MNVQKFGQLNTGFAATELRKQEGEIGTPKRENETRQANIAPLDSRLAQYDVRTIQPSVKSGEVAPQEVNHDRGNVVENISAIPYEKAPSIVNHETLGRNLQLMA